MTADNTIAASALTQIIYDPTIGLSASVFSDAGKLTHRPRYCDLM
jgi:hypothetical protein